MSAKAFYSSACEKIQGRRKGVWRLASTLDRVSAAPTHSLHCYAGKACRSQGWQQIVGCVFDENHDQNPTGSQMTWATLSPYLPPSSSPSDPALQQLVSGAPRPRKRKGLLYVSLGVCVSCMCSFSGITYKIYKKAWKYGMILHTTGKPVRTCMGGEFCIWWEIN